MTHNEIYKGRVARDERNYPVVSDDQIPSHIIDMESKINKEIVNSMPFMMKEAIKEDRYLMAKKIESNFLSGHIKGENDCSCTSDSDPCYFCGAKDYTLIAISILMDLK
jgi:hypothetical protein